MRLASAYTTTKNVVSDPTRAAMVFVSPGRPRSKVSNPPDIRSWVEYVLSSQNVFGTMPPGGFHGATDSGLPDVCGIHEMRPVKSCCATPATMKSEMPEPRPHLETTS